MAWSYTNNPSTRTIDEVRFLLGDTDADDPQLQDEEITYLLTTYSTARLAALNGARALLAKYARLVDKAVGDLRLSLSQRHEHYQSLIAQLEAGQLLLATPFAGGISIADVAARDADSDRVKPAFARDLHEHPGMDTADDD